MTKQIVQIRQQQHVLQLSWILNNICSNKCAYCPPSLHSGTNHHYEWSHAKAFAQRLLVRYQKIHVTISGGEPTMSPFFPELVDMFYTAGHTIGITTNGARTVRYWDEIAPKLSYICFSWHPSHVDPHFLEKVAAAALHTRVTVRVMMHDQYFDEAAEFYSVCKLFPTFRTEAVRILSELAGRDIGNNYTTEQERWIIDNSAPIMIKDEQYLNNPRWRDSMLGSEFYYSDGTIDMDGDTNYLISTEQTDFRGWSCNIGLESLFVLYDGWVKKANCNQGGYMFHINNHAEHELPTTTEICTQTLCHCGTDVLITKARMLAPDHPYVVQHQGGMAVAQSQAEFEARHRKYIKINPQ